MDTETKKSIEVILSPALYPFKQTTRGFITVIIDVLRATTSMVTAFANGVEKIIPVSELDEAKKYKTLGYLVAAERDGKYLDFADFGNSPFDYMNENVQGKTIVYSTTNGSHAIGLASDADETVIAAFNNISAVAKWIIQQEKSVVILCAGWKNTVNLEDTVCAGLLSRKLIVAGIFFTTDDSTNAAIDLYSNAENDLRGYLEKAAHRERLRLLGADDSLDYCLTADSEVVVPGMKGAFLVDLLKS